MAAASKPPERFLSLRTRSSFSPFSYEQQFGRIALFQACSSTFLQALVCHLKEVIFQPGEVLIQEGDIGNCMYLLNIGVVEVSVGGNVVATLHDGSLFGEMAVITSEAAAAKRTATITAKTVCICWSIDRPALLKVIAAYPKDGAVIAAHADKRLKDLVDKGVVPAKPTDRLWLRKQFQSKTDPKKQAQKQQAVARAQLKFLAALKKKSSVAPEEASMETGLQEPGSAARSFLAAFRKKKSGEVSQSGKEITCETSGEYSSVFPTCSSESSQLSSLSEPSGIVSQIPEEDEEERRSTSYSEPCPTNCQMNKVLEVISVKRRHSTGRLDCSRGETKIPKGFLLPPMMPPVKRRSHWSIGETAEVSKARTSAFDFLAKRGALLA